MIVIAIIGILAAALFPSLTAYLARGRDTSRAAGIKDISTAVAAYTIDNGGLVPDADSGTCVPRSKLQTNYLKSKWPVDPTTVVHGWCTNSGSYGYGTGTNNGTQTVVFSAYFESPTGWNVATVSGWINPYQGSLSWSVWAEIDSMKKWAGSGSGYVIRN